MDVGDWLQGLGLGQYLACFTSTRSTPTSIPHWSFVRASMRPRRGDKAKSSATEENHAAQNRRLFCTLNNH